MLHEILTERRRSIGMSIDELVEKSCVPKGTVTKVLTGVSTNPALETVKAIAYALGLTLNDLVDDKPAQLSSAAIAVAHAYERMSEYGRAIIDFVVAQEEKQKREAYGTPKILCGGMKYVPIGTPDGFKELNQTGTVETKEAAKREQHELEQEENVLNSEKS